MRKKGCICSMLQAHYKLHFNIAYSRRLHYSYRNNANTSHAKYLKEDQCLHHVATFEFDLLI